MISRASSNLLLYSRENSTQIACSLFIHQVDSKGEDFDEWRKSFKIGEFMFVLYAFIIC